MSYRNTVIPSNAGGSFIIPAKDQNLVSGVTPEITNVIEIGIPGPQGPAGKVQQTGSLLLTASIEGSTLTFTKGDQSTFNLRILSSSYAATASFLEVPEGERGVVSASYALTSSFASNAATATTATTATNANNAYVNFETLDTISRVPTIVGYADGNYQLKSPTNEIIYYQRTGNPVTGESGTHSDYLFVGGGSNTAGGIYLNSTVTRYNFIYSDYNTFYIKAGGGSTGDLRLIADNELHLSGSKVVLDSAYYVDGIEDVTVSAGSTHEIGLPNHIIFVSYTGANGTANIELPTVNKSENRQIRIMTDSSINNSKDIDIIPNSLDTATIDGAATFNMDRAYDGVMLMCHNSNWWVIQRKSK